MRDVRWIGLLLGAICLLSVPGAASDASAGDRQVLVMGVNYWPPYLFPSDHEHAPGFAQEILTRCVEPAGFRMEYRDSSIPEIFDGLKAGTFDVHVLSYRNDRAEYLDYGHRPLFESAYRPFVAVASDIEILSLKDFDGLRLGHKRNMRYTEEFFTYVDRRREEGTLVELDSENEIVQQLVAGEIDVAVMMMSSGMRRAAALGLLDQIRALDYDLKTAAYPLALSKRSKHAAEARQILDRVDACILELERSGEMDALVDRYADLVD